MKTRNFVAIAASMLALITLPSFDRMNNEKNANLAAATATADDGNLILKPVADLNEGELYPVNNDKEKPEEKNMWIYRVSSELSEGYTKVVKDKSLQHNVIRCNFGQQKSWYGTYLTYRTHDRNLAPGTYRLTFNAKGTSDKSMKVIILGNGTECFTVVKRNPKEAPAGYKQIPLNSKYTKVSIDFDFSKTVKAPYSYPDGNGDYKDASSEVLNNFFILFSPVSEETEFYLDDVKLEKVNN